MTGQFPILKLDNEAQKCVFRRLNLEGIIAFSSISTKAFNIIKLLKVETRFLNMVITTMVKIRPVLPYDDGVTWYFRFANNAESAQPLPLATPRRVEVRKKDGTLLRVWKNISLNLREWIQLFMVLDVQEGIHLSIYNDRFDQTFVKKALEGFKITNMHLRGSIPVPSLNAKNCSISDCQTGNFDYQKMLLQNNQRSAIDDPKVRILDDLLVCNARGIICELGRFLESDFNKFLKAWIKGSNPRLERLDVNVNFGLHVDDVPVNFGLKGGAMMEGIQFTEIPEEKMKKYSKDAKRVCKMRSAKGVLAEIRVFGNDESCTVVLLIGRDFVY